MASIQGIYAREILDSRGIPSIETTLWLDSGAIVATSVPGGTSVGKYEAKELRDGDQSRRGGKGVLRAVATINTVLAPKLIGKDPTKQDEIDTMLIQMDGTKDKANLGANTLLSISQAVLKAGAVTQNQPVYYYLHHTYGLSREFVMPANIYTVINGGAHGADNLDIQEFQIIPASHLDFPTSLEIATAILRGLEKILIQKGATHSVGMVGGFTPNLYSNSDVFEILVETIKASPYTFAQDIFFGVDVAASSIYSGGKYKLKDRPSAYSTAELVQYYKKLRDLYNVFLIEDPFQEDDEAGWKKLMAELGETTKVVGDSLTVTNIEKTKQAITKGLCNAILIKPNQIGTIKETVDVIRLAREANWQVVMSHRSGETNDDIIADLAVGLGADYTKFGPPQRGERVAKYNRLDQIYQEMLAEQQSRTTQGGQ